MSAESVRQLLTRAVAEPEFRGLLFADPRQALAGHDLSQDEAAALGSLSADEFDAAVAGLETRESRATLGLGQVNAQPTGFPPLGAQPSGFPQVNAQPSGF